MPAKNVNDNAGIEDDRGVLGFFASKLAPTGTRVSSAFCVSHGHVRLPAANERHRQNLWRCPRAERHRYQGAAGGMCRPVR
ncbi:hypothetical protein F3K53_03385 [Pseudomonas veronii]|uniref:Uncharacterized protein n=1 Tax=Pseudomonas veronii TaxID=76761 RepID=A0A5M8FP26_PSEVE|nr:hypothetical protein F3K53_03385 [Pseudomonas veronii]